MKKYEEKKYEMLLPDHCSSSPSLSTNCWLTRSDERLQLASLDNSKDGSKIFDKSLPQHHWIILIEGIKKNFVVIGAWWFIIDEPAISLVLKKMINHQWVQNCYGVIVYLCICICVGKGWRQRRWRWRCWPKSVCPFDEVPVSRQTVTQDTSQYDTMQSPLPVKQTHYNMVQASI